MPPSSTCPATTSFEELLRGQMTYAEAGELTGHLMHCALCAQTIHTLLAHSDPSHSEEAVRQVRALLTRSGTDETGEWWRFLAPPQGPGEIGRLGVYRVVKVLGAGGMGIVFEAEDPRLHRRVALKVLRPAQARSPAARASFLREVRAAAAIENDHVVVIHDAGEDREVPFLAMQLLQGESLADRLQREKCLPITEVLRIGREAAEGLAAAHTRGLAHGDVSPANLWLEAESGRVKVLDFGLAQAVGEGAEAAPAGTLPYLAPERFAGAPVSTRADLFGLGCVLYRMCTGQQPFKGESWPTLLLQLAEARPVPPRRLNRDVSAGLARLILRLLMRDPARRPSARAVVKELAALEGHGGRRFWPSLAGAAVLALIALGSVILWPRSRSSSSVEDSAPRPVAVPNPPRPPEPPRMVEVLQLDLKEGGIAAAAFVPGSSGVLTGGPYGVGPDALRLRGEGLCLWDASTGRQTARIDGSNTAILVLAISGDGRLALTGGQGLEAHVWDLVEGRCLHTLPDAGPVMAVCLTPDGRRGYSANLRAKTIQCWDLANGKLVGTLSQAGAISLALLPDGRLVSAGHGGVQVWDADKATLALTLPWGGTRPFVGVGVAPDGRVRAIDVDGVVRVWDVGRRALVRQFTTGHRIGRLGAAFSPDGRRLLLAGADGTVRLWDVRTAHEVNAVSIPGGGLWSASFSVDGRQALTTSIRSAPRLWRLPDPDAPEPERRPALNTGTYWGHENMPFRVALVPGSELVLSSGGIYTIPDPVFAKTGHFELRLWNGTTGTEVRRFAPEHRASAGALAVAHDGSRALSGCVDSAVRLWDMRTGACLQTLHGHQGHVHLVWLDADGQQAISAGGRDGTIRFWDLERGVQNGPALEHNPSGLARARLDAVTFLPNGRLASAGSDGVIKVWDPGRRKEKTKGELFTLRATEGVWRLAGTPAGTLLAGYASGKVEEWDLARRAVIRSFMLGSDLKGAACAFSPDGRHLLFATPDHSLHLWDTASGKELRSFVGHRGRVADVAFASDGQRFASASEDGSVRTWQIPDPNAPH